MSWPNPPPPPPFQTPPPRPPPLLIHPCGDHLSSLLLVLLPPCAPPPACFSPLFCPAWWLWGLPSGCGHLGTALLGPQGVRNRVAPAGCLGAYVGTGGGGAGVQSRLSENAGGYFRV